VARTTHLKCAVFVVLATLCPAFNAAATPILDQRYDNLLEPGLFSEYVVQSDPNSIIGTAQTFTVGLSGWLTEVDLLLFARNATSASAAVPFEIRTIVGGRPGDTVLSSGVVMVPTGYAGSSFLPALFPSIAVDAGEQLAMYTPGTTVAASGDVQWFGDKFGGYGGGTAFQDLDGDGAFSGRGETLPSADAAFRTYVDPSGMSAIPEPGTMLLLGSGLIAFVFRLRRRR
jgi:hypothetical protein